MFILGMQISFLIRFVRLKMGFPVRPYFEMRNLNVPFFPSCRFFPFRLYSLVFKNVMNVWIQGGGGGKGVHPPIPGLSQVRSNSIEISIMMGIFGTFDSK